ncbi:MAG: hypothetical protein ACI841_002295, partial [Planctomycetota bacterium]
KRLRDEGSIELLLSRGGRLLRKTLPLDGRQPRAKVKKAKEAGELAQAVYEGMFGEPFTPKKKPESDKKDEDTSEK